jgi:hypothetical protein
MGKVLNHQPLHEGYLLVSFIRTVRGIVGLADTSGKSSPP